MRAMGYIAAILFAFMANGGMSVGGVGAVQARQHLVDKDANPSGKVSLSVTANKMSAEIEGARLDAVLAEFSKLTGVKVSISESRAGDNVSASFENLSFANGIKEIVGENYTLISGRSDEATKASVLAKILILGSATGVPQVLEEDGSEQTIVQGLSGRALDGTIDPTERIQALEDLSHHYGQKQNSVLKPVFESALRDVNEQIRLAALEAIQKRGLEVDVDVLRSVSAEDENPDIRKLAIEEVADRSEPKTAREFLSQAFQDDPDPEVQQFAQSTLERLRDEHDWMYNDNGEGLRRDGSNE